MKKKRAAPRLALPQRSARERARVAELFESPPRPSVAENVAHVRGARAQCARCRYATRVYVEE